jgi:hypothetical protein
MSSSTEFRGKRAPATSTVYTLYKKATASVSDWILIKVQRTGHALAKTVAFSVRTRTQNNYSLRVSQFVPFTTIIVNATNPRIEVPAKIVKLAEVSVSARMASNLFWKGRDLKSDAGHEHFIDIIRKVYHLLRDHLRASSRMNKEKGKTQTGTGNEWVSGLFDLLESEGLGWEDEEAEGAICNNIQVVPQNQTKEQIEVVSPPKSKNPKSKKARDRRKAYLAKHPEAEREEGEEQEQEQSWMTQEDDAEDPYFVLYCLLIDLSRMRSYIKVMWAEYMMGMADLASVRIMTWSSFELLVLTSPSASFSYNRSS